MASSSAMAAAAYGTMPFTICIALVQRRLPGKVTGQLCSVIGFPFLGSRKLLVRPFGAGKQPAVVVALGDQHGADRQAVRPLEHRQRDLRHMQDGPELEQWHALESEHPDGRFAERRRRQQHVMLLPERTE